MTDSIGLAEIEQARVRIAELEQALAAKDYVFVNVGVQNNLAGCILVPDSSVRFP